MVRSENEVGITVRATSEGLDVYRQHGEAIKAMGRSAEGAAVNVHSLRSALTAGALAASATRSAMSLLGIQNDLVTKGLDVAVIALTGARAALSAYKAISEVTTGVNVLRAISEGLASPWAVAGIAAGAAGAYGVAAAYGFVPNPLAGLGGGGGGGGPELGGYSQPTGGPGVERGQYGWHGEVSRPTMFLAGEAGRERVDIGQMDDGGGVGFSIGKVEINVATLDPEATGRALTDYLNQLKQAGR